MHYSPSPVPLAATIYVKTQVRLFTDMAQKTLGGIEQLATLNLGSSTETLAESKLAARQYMAVCQPQEFFFCSDRK